MKNLFATIQAILELGGKIFGIASTAAGVVRKAQSENRQPTQAELDTVRKTDDDAREDLVSALGGPAEKE